jgi:hypothetical protein
MSPAADAQSSDSKRSGTRSDRYSPAVTSQLSSLDVNPHIPASKVPEGYARTRSHTASSAASKRRLDRRGLQALAEDLSARDWAILHTLDQHPFLTTSQLQTWHFVDHASLDAGVTVCRRVLRRLAALRILEALDRRIGGLRAGSKSIIWKLGPVGDRLLQQASGDGIRRRRKEPSPLTLDHSLAVVDCHLQVIQAGREGHLELVTAETEPACWRRYLGFGGSREILKPDLALVTATADFEDHWFFEIDRGTESLPTVLRKCRQYETYRHTGQEQQATGIFPLVLWILPDAVRREKVRAAVSTARDLDAGLFRYALQGDVSAALSGAAG